MADGPIRILIADDNASVRYGLKVFIELYEDFQWVAEATDGSEAVALCAQLQPDLVLMDLVMPHMDGIAATQKICEQSPDTKILVLTSSIDYDLIHQAMKAGAKGFLLKNINIDTLEAAVRAAVL